VVAPRFTLAPERRTPAVESPRPSPMGNAMAAFASRAARASGYPASRAACAMTRSFVLARFQPMRHPEARTASGIKYSAPTILRRLSEAAVTRAPAQRAASSTRLPMALPSRSGPPPEAVSFLPYCSTDHPFPKSMSASAHARRRVQAVPFPVRSEKTGRSNRLRESELVSLARMRREPWGCGAAPNP
jgi:hypothetical protein